MARRCNTGTQRRSTATSGGVNYNGGESPSSSSATLSSYSESELTGTTIEQLPPELIMHILSYLTYDNVARLRAVGLLRENVLVAHF